MADFKQIKSIQISKMASQHGNSGKIMITLQVEGAEEVSVPCKMHGIFIPSKVFPRHFGEYGNTHLRFSSLFGPHICASTTNFFSGLC